MTPFRKASNCMWVGEALIASLERGEDTGPLFQPGAEYAGII